MSGLRLGVDVGGTFTDLVALSEGELITAKVPSTPRDQSVGVMNAISASGVDAGSLSALAHGMTVATNALLERRGARTALVTTEGFRDVLEIARQNRPLRPDPGQAPRPRPPRAALHREGEDGS
jgi:N-methylhydantoinase A